ncbi:MAG: ABC transporter ATP-binding protein [Alicyclobacillaceae bacterium]|nr:ABC transporter ATP-binding protein [Alicyclobacillaceae bacterium]
MGVIGAQRTGGEGLAGNGAAAHAAVPPAGGEAAQPAGTATVHAGASVHAAAPVHAAGVNFHALLHIIIWLAVVYVLSALFGYVQQYMMAGIAQRMVYNLRREVHEKLSRLPLSFFDSRPHGEVLSRFINDFDNIANTLQQSLTQLISSGITFLGVVVMMLTISPLMTLVTVLTLPLSLLVTRSIARRSQRYFIAQQASLGELNGHVEELYTGHAIIKAFSHEQRSIARFQAINQSLYEAGWRAQFISGIIMPLMNSIGNLGYVLVSVIGGVLVTKRAIQIGDVQAFIQYARQFTQPITQLSSIANIIQSTIASAERVFELLDEPEEQPGPAAPVALDDARGAVRLEDVTFGYNASDPVIQNLNIDVQPGQTIAIVGPTGAGKTTLVNLLMRFYEIDAGHIRVDGVDIRDLRRGDLRSLFGMVLQDAWLFHGTIRDNIAYGREGATEEAVVQAAVAAQADHFIRTLPDGYDTVLNEEASNLSQGQKQLLTIARAILRNPTILILDEATSNVDSRTEVLIQKAMQELMKGRTSFVIAHRLSTIREADLILVMNHGRLVEQGTHAELLARGGFYAELYNSQFAGVPV